MQVFVTTRREVQIILFGKREGKGQLGRPRRIWSDNIVMNLTVEWKGVDWIDLSQDRENWWDFAKMLMQLQVPYSAANLLTSSGTSDFWKGTLLLGVSYARHCGGHI